jgi:hypothetical protein
MELFSNPSDDQLALMGCGLALVVSAMLMYFSFYLGPMRKQQQQSGEQELLKINLSQTHSEDESQRKAA